MNCPKNFTPVATQLAKAREHIGRKEKTLTKGEQRINRGEFMEEKFKIFLIAKGYKEYTPTGNPSTVYDYIKRIKKVCEWENMNWKLLAANIIKIRLQYDIGGIKEKQGKKSHNAVICALRQFEEFVLLNL